jgi:YbbR domain-containing protein
MSNKRTKFFITPTDLKKQLESQLSGTINLLEVDRDTLFIDFYKVELKEVPITPNIKLVPAQNYILDSQLQIEPPIISITGPKKELDFISSISTSEVELNEITEGFSVVVDLVTPEEIPNSQLSVKKVRISGKVFRFSEKILEIPVEVINLPEGTQIKTFPSTISVICKARIERLRDISPSDFKIVANFQEHKGNDQNLLVQLIEKPGDVYSVQLLKNDVEFILKRQ